MDSHAVGERFVLLDRSGMTLLPVERGSVGATLHVTPQGLADDGLTSVGLQIMGDALRPPPPVHLSAYISSTGNLVCDWTRRSSSGWDWLDGVDAPLGCSVERYRITVAGSASSLIVEVPEPRAQISAAKLTEVGSGELKIAVQQVGDFAVSRPTFLSIVRT
jgi:hypothetical protein